MSRQFEGLGDKWSVLLDDPQRELPELVPFVLSQGSTRACWQRKAADLETLMVVYPQDSALRAGVIVQGPAQENMKPKTVVPFLEGLPNDMTVEEVAPWHSVVEGNVSARRNEDGEPVWFYTPLLFRDREALTVGVRHTFSLAGLALGIRPALLDEMTITSGSQYEDFAVKWLEHNPGASRLDVPQLSISLKNARILMPGENRADYQLRAPISEVTETSFGNDKVFMLRMEVGLNTPNPLQFIMYTPEKVCKKGFIPQVGDEIDALLWLQARILD